MINENKNWLELHNIEAWVNKKRIFTNLDLQIKYNENTVILGPNGSGKTSIIKLIDRTLYPVVKKNSKLLLFGKKNINLWEIRRQIGFVSTEIQNRIRPKDPVFEIVAAGLFNSIYLSKGTKINKLNTKKINDLLESMDLIGVSKKEFYTLSDGQKRLVIIARSLINNPKIIILDEPTIQLDFKSKLIIMNVIKSRCLEGITVLQITHDISTVTDVFNKVVLIRNSKIESQGSISEQMTSNKISDLYGIKLSISKLNNYWNIYPRD